ncbi:MAG: cation-translocating P-type ATPase, partial [Firmicutes bacterium]|nr:cation-translocating P-type ATPase [Bacillota bacterium]
MRGLSSREAEERIKRGLDNIQVNSSTRTVKEIVKDNVFTYFNLIFTVLGILLVIAGSFKDLTFMFIVAANTLIGIAQEIRSKNTLDRLKLLK